VPPNRRRNWRVALGTLVVAGSLASAANAKRPVEPGGELVRLVLPVPGSTFEAGGSMVVAWEPGPDLAAFPRAEEWEIFISLDGGRTYLARLTPHLDLDVRRVTVRLPEVPSDDVRLLIRVGDERVEREQPLPGSYRIRPGRTDAPWRLQSPSRGEPARPGAPGVLRWVSGARDGSGWREHELLAPAPSCVPAVRPASRQSFAALPAAEPVAVVSEARPVARVAAAVATPASAPRRPPSLSQLRRRNL
jgi:hypothetical protein